MEFWTRVEESLNGASLRSVCIDHKLNYDTIKSSYRNRRIPNGMNLKNLADALGVTTDWLMNGDSQKASSETSDLCEVLRENKDLLELVKLCQDNPQIVPNLLAMARFATGAR